MKWNLLGIILVSMASLLSLLTQVPAQAQPIENPLRVAVWDPQFGTSEGRFSIRFDLHNNAAQWLGQAGMKVDRVTTEQVADAEAFSAQKFDVFVHQGDIIPLQNLEALKRFADVGGVIVVLAAKIPWLMGVEPSGTGANRVWRLSPANPRFAWETRELQHHFGVQYVYAPGQHDQGRHHQATALLTKYLTAAPVLPAQVMEHRWVVPRKSDHGTGDIYPLIQSHRLDDRETMPQMWVAQLGKRHTVISGSDIFTGNSKPELWPSSRETVVALVRLAGDLRHGQSPLAEADRSAISESTPPPDPLTSSPATDGIDPTGSVALARWGRFNGSSLELGRAIEAGQSLMLELDNPGSTKFPRRLEPGASVTINYDRNKANDQPVYLRVRGAFLATGAGLAVKSGTQSVWNEIFNFVEAGGPGNFQASDLKDVPAEFTRIIYLPPTDNTGTSQAELTIYNPGKLPVYFDAVQVEIHESDQPRWKISMNGGFQNVRGGEASPIDPKLSHQWSSMRGDGQLHKLGAPGDPARFAFHDMSIGNQLAVNPHVEMILVYTPQWAALSPERFDEGKRASRAHTVVPDVDKWEQIVRDFVGRYGDRIDTWELWNEANISQFWRGSAEEYIALYQRIAPLIRELDPGARVMMCGMAGHHNDFMKKLLDAGVLHDTDAIPLHPYAGRSAGWDVVYGQMQGWLFNHGVNKPIDNNEVGSPWFNSEWWTSPMRTEYLQADLTNRGLARLFAGDASTISLFHAGGDAHAYGLMDETGKPRAGYRVFEDYLHLADRDGRKTAVTLKRSDGQPMQGVYVAAAKHEDGSMTLVINPSEVRGLDEPMPDGATQELHDRAGWEVFMGKGRFGDGHAYLTVGENQGYVGLARTMTMDLQHRPMLRVYVSHTQGPWELTIQDDDKKQTVLAKAGGASTVEVDLRKHLPKDTVKGRLTVRCFKDATVRYVSFAPDPLDTNQAIAQWRKNGEPMQMELQFPWDSKQAAGRLRVAGEWYDLPVTLHQSGNSQHGMVVFNLKGRSVLTIRPE